MMSIAERVEFGHVPLNRGDLIKDPFVQLKSWWQYAESANIRPIDAVHLATVDAQGHANGRIVLLKHFDHQGLVFFTNYESEKAKELLKNNSASITIFWAELARQVRVRGMVEKTRHKESEDYWNTRPRGAQLAACASRQSVPIASREVLLEAYKDKEKQFSHKAIPCPAYWGGFRLKPSSFEFWQGRHHRLHDRFLYSLRGNTWLIERLAP